MKLTKKQKEEIIKAYLNYENVVSLLKRFNVSSWSIYKILKDNNINLKGSGNCKPPINNPFEKQNPERDYWLGYIMADGNITYNEETRKYRICLYSKLEYILQLFKKFCYNYPKIKLWNKNGTYGAYWDNKIIASYIINTFNITPNKTFEIDPNIDLNWDIIKGIFDGDGSIRIRKGNYGEFKITTASVKLKDKIIKFFSDNTIKTSIYKKGNAFDIVITNKQDIKTIYSNFYKDTNLPKLIYKYEKFVALFSNE